MERIGKTGTNGVCALSFVFSIKTKLEEREKNVKNINLDI